MNKTAIALSIVASLALAKEAGTISTESKQGKDGVVQNEQLERAYTPDLASALSNNTPDVAIKRTTGYGQDIFVRGFGYEDVNIEIDDTKIYGGCPNHMDPPLAHISPNEVEDISIIRGPFDVSSFGNLGAKVNVTTSSIKEGLSGNVNAKYGSYDYQDYGAKAGYGSKYIDIEAGAGYASQKPYKDGNGDNIIDVATPKYKSGSDEEDLYKTYGYYLKGVLKPVDSVAISLDTAVHKTDQALYPGKPMDGVKDDTLRAKGALSIFDIGSFSDKLELSGYQNNVDHDMDNYTFRIVAPASASKTVTSSNVKGYGIANQKAYKALSANYGINGYTREHKATMNSVNTGRSMEMLNGEVSNLGAFADIKVPISSNILNIGARFDRLSFKNNNSNITALRAVHGNFDDSRDKNVLSGFVKFDHYMESGVKLFAGAGRSYRAPAPLELYIVAQNGTWVGNPNLEPTENNELDLGGEYKGQTYSLEGSLFYSSLKDYIYPSAVRVMGINRKTYENIDAKIYGGVIGGGVKLTDTIGVKTALAYQVGQKDSGDDKDLIDIPPLKNITSLEYDDGRIGAALELIAVATQDNVDSDLNQVKTAGFGVLNLKADYEVLKGFTIFGGVDNILDHSYALSTSYDINPINPTSTIVNEPGRTLYIGGSYKF